MKADALQAFSKLQDAGFIAAIDFQFCRFLAEMESSINEHVLCAACLTSRAYQQGDVCVVLADFAGKNLFRESPALQIKAPALARWRAALQESSVVGQPGDFKPLILDESNRLYFHRLWCSEQQLVRQIMARVHQPAPAVNMDLLKEEINRLFAESEQIDWQKVAVITAVHHLFSIISGGPGTGKTTTVIRLLALLLEQGHARGEYPSIALATPTGKAATRLEDAIRAAKASLQTDAEIKQAMPDEAMTIHQLLGARRHTAHFRFDEDNPLPYDCVIIDEISMVDQVLMSRLMAALRPHARLVMLGDKDQLASVEAGSVLGDICGDLQQNGISAAMQKHLQLLGIPVPEQHIINEPQPLIDHIVLLKKNYRFVDDSGIGLLAGAINKGDADGAWKLLKGQKFAKISVESTRAQEKMDAILFDPLIEQFKAVREAGSLNEMLQRFLTFKVLAAHRKGPRSVSFINYRVEHLLKQHGLISPYNAWYAGRPVMINSNDYGLGLSNGDLGVCVREDANFKVCFSTADGMRRIAVSRLPEHTTAFALTVHKSQGSEFDDIMLVLPDKSSELLSRELLYTGITRARNSVQILSDEDILKEAINNKMARKSGLADHLWAYKADETK